jgi:phenylacetate-CoA ligase
MTAINVHDDTFDEVSQFRFIQERPGELILTVMPKPSFSFESERKIMHSIGSKLGEDFMLKLVKVEQIQRTKSGKFTFLEQRLNIEHSDRVVYR